MANGEIACRGRSCPRCWKGAPYAMHDPIDTALARYPADVAAICRSLRAAARQCMPRAHELWYHSSIGYAVSPSPFDRICYIAPMKGYVNLGFCFGTHLEDPHHLLEGRGARMRHVKVRSFARASEPAIAALLRAAWQDGATSVAQVQAQRASRRAERLKRTPPTLDPGIN